MENISSRYKAIAIIFITIVPAMSMIILSGWYVNSADMKRAFVGQGAMNPVAALDFILLTGSFILSISPNPAANRWGRVIAILVICTGIIRFAEILKGMPTNISEWLFSGAMRIDLYNGKPNEMAPNTALSFVLLGTSLTFFSLANRKKIMVDIFACSALLISSLSIIGFLYSTPEFYFINSLVPMALPTAICFCIYSLALLFYRSDTGLCRVLTSRYQGSRIGRNLLPFAIIIPIGAGALSLYGQRSGIYSPGYGTATFSMVTVVLLVLLIWKSAISINKSSQKLVHEVERTKQLSGQLHEEQRKAFEQTLMLTKMKLNQQLIEATINGQEKEKKQMGMELHDHINQILASTKLYIEMANGDEVMRSTLLQKSREQLTYAMSEIRNLSKSMVLHSEATGGILRQMHEMVAHIEQTTGIYISMQMPENLLNNLAGKKQVAIYRIVEEQLNNIMKHAQASYINIKLERELLNLHLHIEDDGKGFDPDTRRMGIGLSNIESRARMLQGQMEIISSPGRGCKLKIIFPERCEMEDDSG